MCYGGIMRHKMHPLLRRSLVMRRDGNLALHTAVMQNYDEFDIDPKTVGKFAFFLEGN